MTTNPVPRGLPSRRERVRPSQPVPLVRGTRRLPQILPPAEVDELTAALRTHRDRAMVAAVVLGGLRRCEVLGLRLEDLRGAERRVFVVDGKGGHQRLVPVSGRFLTEVGAYLDLQRPPRLGTEKVFVALADYLDLLAQQAAGRDSHPERVRASFLVADVDGKIVGRVSIRHELNEYLEREGGHIGFGVLREHRRRGYAIEILCQALDILAHEGLATALVTCHDDNIASAAVIERCGGKLADRVDVDGADPSLPRAHGQTIQTRFRHRDGLALRNPIRQSLGTAQHVSSLRSLRCWHAVQRNRQLTRIELRAVSTADIRAKDRIAWRGPCVQVDQLRTRTRVDSKRRCLAHNSWQLL